MLWPCLGGRPWWAVGKHVGRLTPGLGPQNGLTRHPASSVARTSRPGECPRAVPWEGKICTKEGAEYLPPGKRAGVGGTEERDFWVSGLNVLRRKNTVEEPWSPSTRFQSLGSRGCSHFRHSLDTLLKQNAHTDTASRKRKIQKMHTLPKPGTLTLVPRWPAGAAVSGQLSSHLGS